METLEEAILWLAPKIDLLHDCLGIGRFAEVAISTDGYFLGLARGDCGFNYFLGHPSEAAAFAPRPLLDHLKEFGLTYDIREGPRRSRARGSQEEAAEA